ncbi:MAG: 4-alpha-glucanotransferase [Dehalococcoidales bacterium]|nr:4-alpha-glucanotransferase [Dehalococcoidales bacterium]
MPAETGLLLKLAQLYGIQTAYYGSDRKRNPAQAESLLAIMKSLGAPVSSLNDLPLAYYARKRWLYQRIIEPVIVAWDGKLESIIVRLPSTITGNLYNIRLILEDGTQSEWQLSAGDVPAIRRMEVDNSVYYEKKLPLNKKIPLGYHHLTIETHGHRAETLILSAPVKAYITSNNERQWGVFMPLYSLHSRQNWGTGNFSDMKEFTGWVGGSGGNSIATLPLLATFLEKPCEPSPYLPVSKLFWNEFFIDVTRVPELPECPDAQVRIDSLSFQQAVASFRRARLVDYFQQMALKRTVLAKLCQRFFSNDSTRYRNFMQFIAHHPDMEEYARFRAVMEKQNKPWHQWQNRLQNGNLKTSDYDEQTRQYHLYVQWLAHEQICDVTQHASGKGVRLYLDLPLGTHPDGFDTWRYRDIFVNGVSVGAPPDTVFTRGQNWTFPPLHPDSIRETGYAYVIAYLRHHLQFAKTLRIDHIMGLHRLFFIPIELKSSQGMYVRYHPEELYAILSIESHRHQSAIVGEDLGIVPRVVRATMNHHGLQRMWVMHYELAGNTQPLLSNPHPHSVVSLNTHDMPPFASFWTGQDITDRARTGIITEAMARKERAIRAIVKKRLVNFLKKRGLLSGQPDTSAVLKGCLSFLAASRSRLLLVNMEDLWLETNAQNIPSTTTEHPNWLRKARLSFESFCQMPQIATILREINRLRSGEGSERVARETEKGNHA